MKQTMICRDVTRYVSLNGNIHLVETLRVTSVLKKCAASPQHVETLRATSVLKKRTTSVLKKRVISPQHVETLRVTSVLKKLKKCATSVLILNSQFSTLNSQLISSSEVWMANYSINLN